MPSLRGTPALAAAAGHGAVDEHAQHDIAPGEPFLVPTVDQCLAVGDRQGLVGDPGHPWTQVFDAVSDHLDELSCVILCPAAQGQRVRSGDVFR
ncbi:MAG: hypothetical protein WAL22_15080 [Solirubrobacteraceae bacterium]